MQIMSGERKPPLQCITYDLSAKGEDMRRFTIFLILATILTACAPNQINPTPVNLATATPEPYTVTMDGTFETSLLATVWKGQTEGTFLFPFDPVSRDALPGYKPIPLGYSSYHAFSPDRSKLAVVSFPKENALNGSLVLIDLPTWKSQQFELKLIGWANSLVFSPDGKRLAIAYGESNYKLAIVDTEQGVITAQSQTDSFVTRLEFTQGGDALMLYGQAVGTTNGLSANPPQVTLLDATDLSSLWSARLEGVRNGVFPKDETVTEANLYEPGNAFYLSPGLAFAPDRDALYIVHADSEQLTTVDFESRSVETVEIQAKLTLFESLLSLTARVAHAKIGDGITRQAVASPDGQFLYIVGVNNATQVDQSGNWQMEQTPLGLDIVRTSDGSRVERFESNGTELSISPDGRFLYLRNWGKNTPSTEIFDTSTQQVILRRDKVSAMPALLMNGEFLLASTYSTSETSHHMSLLQPDGSSVLAEWTDKEFVWWLTP
jgi:DNA-binding beta-propeller fold protein YncE